ncbi:MAG: DUF5913 domain-containing protein, partial [Oscillospiraceae bacterium]|nr:DUF5913 domain-containing protein [Oscillospiraceae bacterium]
KTEKGPSRDWLGIIKTSEARNKIRLWFKQERRDENITHGKASFESELKKSGFSLPEFTGSDALPDLLKKLGYPTTDDFFAAIGYGGISSQRSLNRIREELISAKKESLKAQLGAELPEPPAPPKQKKHRSSMGVIIEGQDDCLVKFAKCCSPLPGDEIIGFTTRGFGVSIHRADCKNYIKSAQNAENSGRWLAAAWDMDSIKNEGFTAGLKIFSFRNDGIVNDITSLLRSLKVRYVSIAAKDTSDGGAFTEITVADVKPEMLDTLTRRIGELDGVYRVDR